MGVGFDIAPTAELPGLHMDGVVARRFLVDYPVPPEKLRGFVPPGGELVTFGGMAWVSACAVKIVRMRPSVLPGVVGVGMNYLVHRTKARLPYPDGELRETVLLLEVNFSNALFATGSRVASGMRSHARHVEINDTGYAWSILMRSGPGKVLYEAEIPKASLSEKMPKGSCFATVDEADSFILGMAYGAQWQRGKGSLRLVAETHRPWHLQAGACHTAQNVFLERVCGERVEADHVLMMENVPHCFPFFGVNVPLEGAKS